IKGILDLNASDVSQLSNGENDPRAAAMTESFQPNAGVGILYKSPKWFLGVGAPRILTDRDTASNGGYTNEMDAYLLAGVVLNLKNKWKFRPSTQVRLGQSTSLSIDATATFIYNNIFYIGLNHRIYESVGVIAQYQVSSRFKLGYSFDLGVSSTLRATNFGSHEVALSYDMNFTKSLIATPRFF
ncbi:MAG: type IX secretion system membrane protein PorP/SprF, partial [Crocinitomicaceae bacterium]|nr:type IX secretion system membrane protein PorP/SprF [Crocinitomicaceae bacterium]